MYSTRMVLHFNPRSPCGERQTILLQQPLPTNFNPRSPCGERPAEIVLASPIFYFNPRSPCGERQLNAFDAWLTYHISIHAPHAGSDLRRQPANLVCVDFNPRSPCGERRCKSVARIRPGYFNPRSPCGERLQGAVAEKALILISIHAPHAGSDNVSKGQRLLVEDFNPRSPCGERQNYSVS